MRIKKAFFFIIILYWPLYILSAQNNLGHNYYTIDDGLPSNEVYCVKQDLQGDLWMGTDYGIMRYDGVQMKSYTMADGLPDNTAFREYIDHKNRVWFMCYTGGVFYIEDDEIKTPRFNRALIDSIGEFYIRHMYVDENDVAYFANPDHQSGYYKAKIGGDQIEHVKKKIDITLLVKEKAIYTVEELNALTGNPIEKFLLFYKRHHQCSTVFMDGKLEYISLLNKVYHYDNNRLIRVASMSSIVLDLHIEGDDLLVGLTNGGVACFQIDKTDKSLQKTAHFFSESISGITCDREGVFWFTTVGKGVIRVSSLEYKNYSFPKGFQINKISRPFFIEADTLHMLEHSQIFRNKLAIKKAISKGVSVGEISVRGKLVPHKKAQLIRLIRENTKYRLDGKYEVDGLFNSNWLTWLNRNKFSAADIAEFIPNEKKVYTYPLNFEYSKKYGMTIQSTSKTYDNHVIKINKERFTEFDENGFYFDSNDYETPQNIKTVYKIAKEDYWIGAHFGLYRLRADSLEDWTSYHPKLDKKIQCIDKTTDGHYVFGTINDGIIILLKAGNTLSIDENNGLTSNDVRHVKIVGDTIWAATSNAVNRIVFRGDSLAEIRYVWLNVTSENHQVETLFPNGKEFLFFRNNKLSSVDAALKNQGETPQMLITEIMFKGENYDVNDAPFEIEYGDSISFGYRMNTLKGGPFAYYRYRLKGLHENWLTTKENKLHFSGLSYGAYEFEIQGVNNRGIATAISSQIAFTIPRPFVKSFLFYSLLVSVLGLVCFGLVFWYHKRRQKQLVQEKAMLNSTIFALKMQINPHFIFNALNSIQYYIASSEKRAANIFLAKFSDLMRDILSSAEHRRVSLEKEMTQMRNYIELENMRTGDTFDWEIVCDERIDPQQYNLPSMILQPIIENAIWHGFSQLECRGKLQLIFSLIEGDLSCQIIDNGIGVDTKKITETNHNKNKLHRSIGLKNVIQRLELIGKMEDNYYPITFENLNQSHNKYKGTVVTILIPQKDVIL